MFIDRKFPKTRLRRLRANANIAELIAESSLSQTDLIQPLFVKEKLVGTEAIESMPGISRYSDCLLYTSPSPRDATLSRMPSSA